jgi:hypothetical protein
MAAKPKKYDHTVEVSGFRVWWNARDLDERTIYVEALIARRDIPVSLKLRGKLERTVLVNDRTGVIGQAVDAVGQVKEAFGSLSKLFEMTKGGSNG